MKPAYEQTISPVIKNPGVPQVVVASMSDATTDLELYKHMHGFAHVGLCEELGKGATSMSCLSRNPVVLSTTAKLEFSGTRQTSVGLCVVPKIPVGSTLQPTPQLKRSSGKQGSQGSRTRCSSAPLLKLLRLLQL